MANMNNFLFDKPENRLELLMQKNNYTLKKLSDDTGIPITTLSGYKKNLRTPKKKNAQILAEYFGVSIPYLLGLDDNPVLVNPGSTKEIFKGFAKGKENEINDLIFELNLIQINKKELLEKYLTLDSQEKNIVTKVKEIYHENY